MKKFRLSACLVALLVFIVINSCKKDEQLPANTINTPTLNVASRLAASSQMQPQDLLAWYASSPFASKMNPKWGKALKTTVNGNEVIKVPLSRDAALFFTKTNGVLNVSVYKWLDKQKGAKTFTGNVVWFSFTDDVIHGAIFDKGILIKSAVLNPPITMPIAGGLQGQSLSVSKFAPKVLVAAAPDLIGAALCWLTGGTWTGFQTNWCDYTNSIWASISDFLDGLFGGGVTSGGGDGGDGGDGGSSADGSASGSYTGSDGSTVTVGTITGTNGGGGGMAYVTVNPPCNVNSGSGQSFALAINHTTAYKVDQDPSDGGDGDGNVPCPDPTTVWVPIPIYTSPDVLTDPVNDGSNVDDTDDSGNVVETDCGSFVFVKTSVANWQEAGVTDIRLKWVWIGGSNGGMSRTLFLPSIVFGLPTQYQNRDGSITYLSAGQAAVRAAKITEAAKQSTYYEFQNSPYSPTDIEVLTYFKNQISILMATQRGTAGTIGSGSSGIIFREEVRSTFFPYSCGN